MSDPYPLATWRFEQIAFLMDETLPKALREHRLKEVTREGVPWPSGEVKPIGRSTLYRWLTAYRKHGLKGLLPGPRKDKGKSREDRSSRSPMRLPCCWSGRSGRSRSCWSM